MKKYFVTVVDKDGKEHEFAPVTEYVHENGNLNLTLQNGQKVEFKKEDINESAIKPLTNETEPMNS